MSFAVDRTAMMKQQMDPTVREKQTKMVHTKNQNCDSFINIHKSLMMPTNI